MSTLKGSIFNTSQFPHQKRSQSQKTKKFFEECVDAGASVSGWAQDNFGHNAIRTSRRNKVVNYNLLNNVIDPIEAKRATDPFGIQFQDNPIIYRNYPLINPNINLLCGEERKRVFAPMFVLTSSDAVTEKLRAIQDRFNELAVESLTAGETDEQTLQKKIKEFDRWRTFSYKDKRERMANQIVQYLYHTQNLKEHFSKGFEDLLAAAEEIFVVDIIGKEPRLRRGNPINFYTIRGGESYKIEDHEIIVEDGYLPPGEAIDRYRDHLKDSDISKIEQGYSFNMNAKKTLFREHLTNQPISFDAYVEDVGIGNILELNKTGAMSFGGAFDYEGNVKVTRVVWRGLRKIGILEYHDEDGNFVRDIVPESYEPQEELGEQVDWTWVTEWYEGTRIADDIYVKLQPLQLQVRTMENLSAATPGIIGTTFNIGSFQARSMVDMTKDYQYLYNKIMTRTEHAIAKYIGKVGKINSALIPDGWGMEKYLYYLYNMNLMVEDPFNEGQKGVAQGKLAGSMSQTGNQTEIGDAEFIQQHLSILEFIENRVDEITGITPQRKGAVDNRETVGGVERAVMQSSHITEKWFAIHDDTRIRALSVLLEAAKIAWSGQSFVRAFVLDDGTESVLDFDSESFEESSYGGYLTTDSENQNLLQQIRGLAQHLIQNGGSMSMVVDLYRTKDIGSLQRKIEMYEQEIQERAEQAQKAEQEALAAEQQAEQELELLKIESDIEQKELDRELEQYKIDQDNYTKIRVAEINAFRFQEDQDMNNNQIPDQLEVGALAVDQLKAQSDAFNKQKIADLKNKELDTKKQIEERKIALEEKKLSAQQSLQKQKDKAAMAREKLKSRTALRNKVSGEK
jgi:hypothetical protein